MLRLALPVLVEQFLGVLVGLVDTWLAGNFLAGEAPLAAIGLMSYVLWLLPSLFAAIAIGATAMTARCVGAGQAGLAVRVTGQALVLGLALAAAATALAVVAGEPFVAVMQLRGDAAELALRYLRILTPVIPAVMVEQVGIACLRGAGDTFSGFVTMVVVNLVNVVLSTCLVLGWGPFPELGWEGLAIGTASGHAVGAVLVLGLLIRGRAGLTLRWRRLRPNPDLMRRLLRIGVPGGIDVLAILLCHLWFVGIINSLGTVDAAAHSLGVRIESLAYLPGSAFQVAAATLVGQFLGAGDRRRAVRAALLACLGAGSVMVAAGGVMFFGAAWLTELFAPQQGAEVAGTTVPLLRLVALAMPALALTMVLSGALRGAGDTRWPLLFTFLGFLGVRIPAAYLLAWPSVPLPGLWYELPGMGWGVLGAWYAMVADVFVRAGLVVWRFRHGGWQRIRVW